MPGELSHDRARRQRWAALLLLLVALAGIAATGIVWRADVADQHGQFSQAVRWRPEVPLYRRQLGESLLLTDPQASERELLAALRLDPYDPLTRADLTTVELARGHWPQAVATTEHSGAQRPSFGAYWRLANLFLSHGDLAGYWQELRLAAPRADPAFFGSMVSRSLTASGDDFAALRRALPPSSVAAASAYLEAALSPPRDVTGPPQPPNRTAALAGEAWLLSLPADGGEGAMRRQAMQSLLETAFQFWPSEAASIWTRAAAIGALPGPAKQAAPPYLRDGDFSPAVEAAMKRWAPEPAAPLRALLAWSWASPAGVVFHPVYTVGWRGAAQQPRTARPDSAAEFVFDGTEADEVSLTSQWILAEGGRRLQVSVSGVQLDPAAEQGISLRLTSLTGNLVGVLPLALTPQWTTAQGSFLPPGYGLAAYRLSLHYQRPRGEMPLRARILISGVKLQ